MDLFSLVAKLMLDAKEYEKAIKDAERSAKGARIDAEGTVSMQDNFTPALQGLKSEGANLDVEGTASLDTETYTTAAQTAGTTAAESLDAEGHASLDDTNYQEKATTASTNADDKLNVEGDATLNTTDYADTASTAATNLGDTLNATGTATLDTSLYGQDASDAAATASGNLNATGTASLDDTTYQTDATDAATKAGNALDLTGNATLDTTQYDTDVSNAQSDATTDLSIDATAKLTTTDYDTSIATATEKAKGLDGILKGLKIGAIVGGVSAVASWVGGALDDTAKYADEVDKSSRRFSISMEAYQEWAHALSQSGASTQDLQRGLLNISKAAQGEGSQEVVDAFGKLGLTDLLDGTHKNEDILSEVITKLAGWEDRSERDYLVQTIFGRNGLNLNALLDSGVDGVKGLIQEAHDLGLIMSDEDVQKGVEYGDLLANVKDAAKHIEMTLVSEAMPALIQLAETTLAILQGVSTLVEDPEAAFGKVNDWLGKQLFGEERWKEIQRGATNALLGEGSEWQTFVHELLSSQGIGENWHNYAMENANNLRRMFGSNQIVPVTSGYYRIFEDTFARINSAKQNQDQDAMREAIVEFGLYVKELEKGTNAEDAKAYVEEILEKTLQGADTRQHGESPQERLAKQQRATMDGVNAALKLLGYTFGAGDVHYNQETGTEERPIQVTKGNTVVNVTVAANASVDDILGAVFAALNAEDAEVPKHNAKGLWEVPYDDYLTRLHRDEMVLTASQARDYKERDHGDSDVVEAIRGLRQDMTNLQIVVGQKTFGRTVVSYSGKRLGGYLGGAEDRLAAGYGWG